MDNYYHSNILMGLYFFIAHLYSNSPLFFLFSLWHITSALEYKYTPE